MGRRRRRRPQHMHCRHRADPDRKAGEKDQSLLRSRPRRVRPRRRRRLHRRDRPAPVGLAIGERLAAPCPRLDEAGLEFLRIEQLGDGRARGPEPAPIVRRDVRHGRAPLVGNITAGPTAPPPRRVPHGPPQSRAAAFRFRSPRIRPRPSGMAETPPELTACPTCDLLHRVVPVPPRRPAALPPLPHRAADQPRQRHRPHARGGLRQRHPDDRGPHPALPRALGRRPAPQRHAARRRARLHLGPRRPALGGDRAAHHRHPAGPRLRRSPTR